MPNLGIIASSNQQGRGGVLGAFDVISTTTLTANASTVTFALPSGYTSIKIMMSIRDSSATTGFGETDFWFNTDTAGTTYYYKTALYSNGSSASYFYYNNIDQLYGPSYPRGGSYSGTWGGQTIDVIDYNNPSKFKTVRAYGGFDANGTGQISYWAGTYQNLNPVTSITIAPNQTGFVTGSKFTVYGVR